MAKARRLGYAVLSTPDIDRQIAYYTEVVGLQVSHRTPKVAVLSSRQGAETLVLRTGDEVRLLGLGFQISPHDDLDCVVKDLERAGIPSVRRPGNTPAVLQVVAFKDVHEIEIELFNEVSFSTPSGPEQGIMPMKIGHVAYNSTDVTKATRFYAEHLGFRRSDWRSDVTVFMRCNADHHTCNFFRGEMPGLHHLAFELNDFAELGRASDFLARRGFPLEWGPGRHFIGHNVACYHFNPDGIRIEFYAEMDQMKDEELGFFDPRPWHQELPQKPRDWAMSTPRGYWNPEVP